MCICIKVSVCTEVLTVGTLCVSENTPYTIIHKVYFEKSGMISDTTASYVTFHRVSKDIRVSFLMILEIKAYRV